jgi:hypothetical protein
MSAQGFALPRQGGRDCVGYALLWLGKTLQAHEPFAEVGPLVSQAA